MHSINNLELHFFKIYYYTVYKAYLVAFATFMSFKLAIIKSKPPFTLNSFLFFTHTLHKLETIEKHNSRISIELSS